MVGFLDALNIEKASIVGNSFGGAIALAAATQHPERVDKIVLMGSVGVPFPITQGLDAVWGYRPSAEAMFPAPRQQWVDSMVTPDALIRALPHRALIVHGREDRVIPLETSLRLLELIPRAEFHAFGPCGHWSQIEHPDSFNALLTHFLTADQGRGAGDP